MLAGVPGEILVLKLVVTPVLIAGATLAGRRWGPVVSGWLVGLPLTSAPVALFLAVEQGTSFAAASALGSLVGAVAEVAFSVAYALVARNHAWPPALLSASAAFVFVGVLFQQTMLGLVPLGIITILVLVIGLLAVPSPRAGAIVPSRPAWDLLARTVVATAVVLAITEAAPVLGPRLSGILATFPVYAATLAVFAHRVDPPSAIRVIRGLMSGLFSFVGFFVVLPLTIERAGIGPAFGAAIVASLVIQAASFMAVVRGRMAPLRAR
jgi:hypothetical protein